MGPRLGTDAPCPPDVELLKAYHWKGGGEEGRKGQLCQPQEEAAAGNSTWLWGGESLRPRGGLGAQQVIRAERETLESFAASERLNVTPDYTRGQSDSEDPGRSPTFREWDGGGITTETGDLGRRLVRAETGAGGGEVGRVWVMLSVR